MLLPPNFVALLQTARKFTGPFAQAAPWQRSVLLSNGKLLASNNRQIVEIDCGVEGEAVFSSKALSLLQVYECSPSSIEISDTIRFAWSDCRYLQIKNEFDHADVVAKLTDLLDGWHMKEGVTSFDVGIPSRAIELEDGPSMIDGRLAPRRGFFYISDGTPASRLVEGETDLRLDDLFAIRRKELEAARKAN